MSGYGPQTAFLATHSLSFGGGVPPLYAVKPGLLCFGLKQGHSLVRREM